MAPYGSGLRACVDKETETLTTDGWKSYDEIEEGEKTYSIDDEGEVVYDIICEKHVCREPKEAIKYSQAQNNFSMVLTPNHRCVIQVYNSRDQKHQDIRFVRAKNLKGSHRILRRPLSFSDDEPEPLSDDFVRLLAWVSSEGSYGSFTGTKSDAVRITITQSQKANPGLCDEIQSLLDRVGGARHFKYDYHPSSTWTLSGRVRERVAGTMPGKRPTYELMDQFSPRQMKLFVDTFLKGDGSKNSEVSWLLTQKDPKVIEVIQAMATLVGYTTTNYEQNSRGNTRLNITKGDKRTDVGSLQKKRTTNEMRWSVTTKTERWIARRDGTVFVTGDLGSTCSRT
jgi:ribonucleoside-triphosphate reductase